MGSEGEIKDLLVAFYRFYDYPSSFDLAGLFIIFFKIGTVFY